MPHATPEARKAYQKAWYERNRERISAEGKANRSSTLERRRAYWKTIDPAVTKARKWKHYKKHSEDVKAKVKAFKQANPDWYKNYLKAHYRQLKESDPEKLRSTSAASRDKLKREAFEKLGDRCAVCGEDETKFLTIDHVHEDGAEHRRGKGGSSRAARDVRAGRNAGSYQLLCWNCNFKKHFQSHPSLIWVDCKKSREKLKREVFGKMGGRCSCCGVDDLDFLTIDHVDGGGSSHRRMVGSGAPFYRWVRKNGSDGLRVLCYNCNSGRAMNRNVCPHERERLAADPDQI